MLRIIRRPILITCGLVVLIQLCVIQSAAADKLAKIHQDLLQDYPIQHISNKALLALKTEDLLIFDVRKPEEYQVSHLDSAIQLSPSASVNTFLSQHGDELAGKTVVFYCSVGVRSSKMLDKLAKELNARGVTQAYNLTGGIFQWHNDQLALKKGQQDTREIHPYNRYWGRLITDKSAITYP